MDFYEYAYNLSDSIRDCAGRVEHPLVRDSTKGLSYEWLSDLGKGRSPHPSANHRVAYVDDIVIVGVENHCLATVLIPCVPAAIGSVKVSTR